MPPAGAPPAVPGVPGPSEPEGGAVAALGLGGATQTGEAVASGGVGRPGGGVPPIGGAVAVREVDLDWRSVAWVMGAFVALVAATNLVRSAPRAITVVIVGTLVALALTPVVGAAEQRFKLRRPAAVAVVVAGLIVVTAAAMALLAPPAINQGQRLSRDLDEIVAQVEDLPIVGDDLKKAGAADKMRTWIEDLPDRLKGADTRIGEAARRTVDGVLVAFLTLLVSISLLLDGDRLVRGVRRVVPPHRRTQADRIGRLAYDTVGRYVAGSLLVAGIAGVSVLVAGLVLGVPLTPLLAVWVAIFDLVPQIGGAAGGIPFVLLGFTQGPVTGVICAVFFILYLQFENHILSPLVVGRSVKLSPPATMTAALVGVSAAGVVGALVAVPVVASVKAIYVHVRQGQPEVPAGGSDENEPEARRGARARPRRLTAPGSGLERPRVGRDVDGVLLESGERHDVERPLMGGRQHDVGRGAVEVGPKPVHGGDAPAVAGREPGKLELRHGSGEVVADATLVLEELGGHHRADRVAAPVLGPRLAAPVPVEPRHGVGAARLEVPANHIPVGHTGSIAGRPGAWAIRPS